MKKSLFFAAFAALMASSCANQETVEVTPGNAIGFDTYVRKATRGGDLTNATLAQFFVYGAHNAEALDFDGETVSNQGGSWSYSPLRYWVKDQTYKFAAVAPEVSASYDYASNTLTVSNYSAGDDDLIVAVAAPYTATETGNQAVGLNFKHALAKVQFTFTTDIANGEVTVSDVNLAGVNSSATLNASYNGGTNAEWSDVSTPETYALTLENGAGNVGSVVKYMLPQSLGDEMVLTFNVKVSGITDFPEVTKDFSVKIKTSDVSEWQTGNVYNYSLKLKGESLLNAESIDFEVRGFEWNDNSIELGGFEEGETPDQPGTDEPIEEIIPVTVTLDEFSNIQLRNNNGSYKGDANVGALEIKTREDGDIMYGLMQFNMPEDLKAPGYEIINANLRLVTTQNKGTRQTNLFDFGQELDITNIDAQTLVTKAMEIIGGEEITHFDAAGQGGQSMVDYWKDAFKKDDYGSAEDWTNIIDLKDYINGLLNEGKNGLSYITLLIAKNGVHNDAMKFACKAINDIEVKQNDQIYIFKAEDLIPQLTITYQKIKAED